MGALLLPAFVLLLVTLLLLSAAVLVALGDLGSAGGVAGDAATGVPGVPAAGAPGGVAAAGTPGGVPGMLAACASLLPVLLVGRSAQVQFWGGSAHEVALMQVDPNLPPHSLQVMLYHCRYFSLPLSAGQGRGQGQGRGGGLSLVRTAQGKAGAGRLRPAAVQQQRSSSTWQPCRPAGLSRGSPARAACASLAVRARGGSRRAPNLLISARLVTKPTPRVIAGSKLTR